MWAAGAVIVVCLASWTLAVVGADAEPSSSPAPLDGTKARFRVDLGYPVGMDGMTVVGVVHRRGGGDERVEVVLDAPGRFGPSVPLVDLSLWPGVYSLWLVAGQPPFGQWPRPWVPPAEAERSCVMEFNLRAGDDVLLILSDIPDRRLAGCPVGALVLNPV
jgi:hypothetical protein